MHCNNTDFMENLFRHKPQGLPLGYFRILHTVPDAPCMDVYFNDKLVAKNLCYKQFTAYMPIPQGTYAVSLYGAGSTNSPIIVYSINIDKGTRTTVAVIGTLTTVSFLAIPDDQTIPLKLDETDIRFVHLSPNAPTFDVTLSNGYIICDNISFKERTFYKTVPADKYTIQVSVAESSVVALTVPDLILNSKTVYTVYIIGLFGDIPHLEALIIIDGFYG